ncbi:serine/threonine-protein kinase [Streptomyces sporangiiformans]|uniref:Serine/threonine protein kinase n=1 Tax=Streptomyces sporangiiformans TaxID=2315329 RepID=A0A505D4L0_9ACTN|nr:serine/threonine-protein kinase [Streptomyces sporangiiformans]TPQ15668.1 serine/threonine protein kinase [Streptomyces sporangiiformans]
MTKPATGDFDAGSGGVGNRIGRYRLLRTLGTGGMGRVCLARSEGGRTVAVKLIKPELAAEPQFRERFRLEVEAARRVSDRWTAPVLDADTEAETPWVATGYIAGPSLEHLVSPSGHGPLPALSVRTLAHGLACALLDIHGAGLVHRDLKPSNVLITIDGPRVIDFGIARSLDAVPGSTLTSSGMVVGSPGFMSPEQIRDEPVGPAADVFCMGAVLAYASTGQTPFGVGGSGGVHAVMFRIAHEEPDLTGIEEPMRGLITDCLAKDPAARPTPKDVIARMQPVATGTSSPPWLPAQIIAELGRSAVQLLDTDTPPHASAPPAPAWGASASGASAPAASAPSPAASPVTWEEPHATEHSERSEWGTEVVPKPGLRPAEPASSPRPRRAGRGRRAAIALGAAAVVAGAAFAASSAGLPLPYGGTDSGSGSGSDAGTGSDDEVGPASDVPKEFVGIWAGEVERDGEPTGQYRRFAVSPGQLGEVVATSISVGQNYECKSDGKLAAKPSGGGGGGGGTSLRLDTKVVSSVPKGTCSALGEHVLSRTAADSLRWEAAGRTAELHRIDGPEKLPEELLGTWQRPLANGGTQRMTVEQKAVGSPAVTLVSDGGGEHCEAGMNLVSMGEADSPVRLAPPAVDWAKSSGLCRNGGSSTVRTEGNTLVRELANGQRLTYTRLP